MVLISSCRSFQTKAVSVDKVGGLLESDVIKPKFVSCGGAVDDSPMSLDITISLCDFDICAMCAMCAMCENTLIVLTNTPRRR